MRAGELCAGYGGLALAVEEVFGAETAWFSEFDAAPSKILAHHWPNVPNHGDMTKIDWSAIEQVDIISGGTPCQDLSAAGKRKGMTEGTRSNLWVNMRESIATQRPKWVAWENVRGAYSACADSEMGQCPGCLDRREPHRPFLRALGRVLGDLSDLRYDTQWRGLRASDVGAPHGRFRVFVLARLRDVGVPRYSNVSDVERGRPIWRGNTDTQQGAWVDRSPSNGYPIHASAANGSHLGNDGTGKRPQQDGRGQSANRRLAASNSEGVGWREGWAESAGKLRRLAAAGNQSSSADTRGAAIGEQTRGTLAEETRTGSGNGSSDHSGERSSTNWGPYEPAIRRWENRLGRSAPRPTEPTGRDGGERLSPRFTEWMMGLPDGWVTDPSIGISRNDQLKACGNGVVPQQAAAALKDMLAAFQKQRDLAA